MSAEIAGAQPGWRGRTANAALLVLGRLPVALWWSAVVLAGSIAAVLAAVAVLARRAAALAWASVRRVAAAPRATARGLTALVVAVCRRVLRALRRAPGGLVRRLWPPYWAPARIRARRRARTRRQPAARATAAWQALLERRISARREAAGEREPVGRLAKVRMLRALAPWLVRLRAGAARERETIAARGGVALEMSDSPLPDDPDERAAALAADPVTHRSVAYFVLALPLAAGGTVAVLAAVVLGVMFTALPLYAPLLDFGPQRVETPEGVFVLEGLDIGLADALLLALLGVALLLCASGLVRLFAAAHVGLGRALLTPNASTRLAAEAAEQRARRQLAVAAADAERRRIERDLHDGAQQRLTALAISIGRARERLAADPTGAATLLDEAHVEAKRAIAEIRELARGIHPAILTDRGLDAALSALAGRAPFPVRIVTALPGRPPEAVESAAYFVVAEALTNAARHAAATAATVSLVLSGGDLVVLVVDDGCGGADPGRGTGLTGLGERAAVLGGRLTVDSPAGGPTVVRAELPCGS